MARRLKKKDEGICPKTGLKLGSEEHYAYLNGKHEYMCYFGARIGRHCSIEDARDWAKDYICFNYDADPHLISWGKRGIDDAVQSDLSKWTRY